MSHKTVNLISLGCARNKVDSEVILSQFISNGYKYTDLPQKADVVVINTCSFLNIAKQESIDIILEISDIKKQNKNMKLVVSGCLSQRYKEKLIKTLPEVDIFLGVNEFHKSYELITKNDKKIIITDNYDDRSNLFLPKINTTSPVWRYVKIAEGCTNKCSFCIIPKIRGPLRSIKEENIIAEIANFTANGVKEINLIAQDLTAYGKDINTNLLSLLKMIVQIEGDFYIRLLYMYPEFIDDDLLDFIISNEKIINYLDIPIQHASDKILKAMGRNVCNKSLSDLIYKIRKYSFDMILRTSVIVGFPGETENDFSKLLEFIDIIKFDHLGCFKYSKEKGTVSFHMKNHIEDDIKNIRFEKIMQKQKSISYDKLLELKGKSVKVIVEGKLENSEYDYIGRSLNQAPEVDGITYIKAKNLNLNDIYDMKVIRNFDYDIVVL